MSTKIIEALYKGLCCDKKVKNKKIHYILKYLPDIVLKEIEITRTPKFLN